MELLKQLVAAAGGAAVALAGAWFLLRTLIRHRLDKEIIRFTSELEQKSDVLKTELSIYAHEQKMTSPVVVYEGS
jgi:hypothetical protein